MTLNREEYEKAVVITLEGSATFHVKLFDAPYTCYMASLRGRFRRRKKERFLYKGDLVYIKLLENNNRTAQICEKIPKEEVEIPFEYSEELHHCSLREEI